MTDSLPTIGWAAAVAVTMTALATIWCILRSRQRTRTYEAAHARFQRIYATPHRCARPAHGIPGRIMPSLERRQRFAHRALASALDPDVIKGADGGGAAQTGRRSPSPWPRTQGGEDERQSAKPAA
jgi:hypothetical protein